MYAYKYTLNLNSLSTNKQTNKQQQQQQRQQQQQQQQTVSLVVLVRKDSTAANTTYNYTLQVTNYTLFHHFSLVQLISHRVP